VKFRFTAPAARDLERVLDYVARHSRVGEGRVSRKMQATLTFIREHPLVGRLTSPRGTRRVVVSPFPYLIFYRLEKDEVVVTAVRYGMRKPR
jgi:toxin ParE1/3/4